MTVQEAYAKYLQERDNVLRKVAAWLNEHAAFVNGLQLIQWQKQVLREMYRDVPPELGTSPEPIVVAPRSRGRGFVWSDLVKEMQAEREGNG